MSDSVQPHVAHQAPLSLGFSRQEYWSGLSFPSPSLATYLLKKNLEIILFVFLKLDIETEPDLWGSWAWKLVGVPHF